MFTNFLPTTIHLIATDLIVQLVIAVVFPLLVIGLGVKFMRNLDNN